jgi:hypothetical protein
MHDFNTCFTAIMSPDVKVKVKVKLSLCFSVTEHHVMKAYWGIEGIASRILDLGFTTNFIYH